GATPSPASEGGGGEPRPRRDGGERRTEGGERREGRGGRNNRRGGRGPAGEPGAAPAPAGE
ncbi:hypothetical protein, partial [Hymenobacter glacialis]|uniref:hypothetical protein n=1 Tax=Hymenobacter glacialis TaxID=1908236 RepID=UPI0018761602